MTTETLLKFCPECKCAVHRNGLEEHLAVMHDKRLSGWTPTKDLAIANHDLGLEVEELTDLKNHLNHDLAEARKLVDGIEDLIEAWKEHGG